jgi:hypothetical protein
LPAKIRQELSPNEKRVENRRKRSATNAGHQYAPYSQSVARRFSRDLKQ